MQLITRKRAGILFCLLALSAVRPAFADEDNPYIHDTSDIGRNQGGVVMSDQLLELGMVTSNGLRLEGEQCLRLGNVERAVKVLQRGVELSPSDMDGRILYAIALEKLLTKQKKRDPKLFNFCVKQWYYISRKAEFYDQKAQARNHLDKLTGQLPKWRDRPVKYLSKVLIPEDGSVKVAFGKGSEEGKKRVAKDKAEEDALR